MRDFIEALEVLNIEADGLLGKSAAARQLVDWAWQTLLSWAEAD